MMKSTILGINSWTQELLLEIISPAIEQLLGTVDPALMPGSFEGVWGLWVITWLRWLSLMRDDDHNTLERKKKLYDVNLYFHLCILCSNLRQNDRTFVPTIQKGAIVPCYFAIKPKF